MSDLPEPLTPADCDLRDFAYLPLDIVRLFGSRFHAVASDSEWRAGVTLWLKSFHQVPAGSVPNDDVELCRLAELGRDIKVWRKLRVNALHGWVLCSDDRFYHPVVCEKVLAAWKQKAFQRKRSQLGNEARWRNRSEMDIPEASLNDPQAILEASLSDPSAIPQGLLQASFNDPKLSKGREKEEKETPSEQRKPLAAAPPPLELTGQDLPKRAAEKRAYRLPEDWEPSADSVKFARDCWLNPQQILAEFRDYWRGIGGEKGRKLDWEGTWRNWCRRQAKPSSPAVMPIGAASPQDLARLHPISGSF